MSRPFDRISFAEVGCVRNNLETEAPRQLQRELIAYDDVVPAIVALQRAVEETVVGR